MGTIAVEFGNNALKNGFVKYLFSNERKERFVNHPIFGMERLEERLIEVTDADISNYLESCKIG